MTCGGAGTGGGAACGAGSAGGGAFLAIATSGLRLTGGGMGDGFSRTETWWITGGTCATAGTGGGAGAVWATTGSWGGVGGSTAGTAILTASGRIPKYTIPEASTAPAAKADTSFQFNFTPVLAYYFKRKRDDLRFGARAVKIA